MSVVSAAFTQTELLQMEVFLVEKLRPSQAKKMQHLKALCFVRPTEENVTLVVEYMKRQTFGGYYICKSRKWRICNISSTLGFYFLSAPCEVFSHIVKEPLLQRLAEGDQNEAVLLVQEVFASFVAVDSFLFTFDISNQSSRLALNVKDMESRNESTDKVVEDLASFFLSIKRRPSIRYQGR